MKNINYVINGVLAVAVIILFVMQFSSKKESTVAPAFTTEGDSTNLLPVAYVNVDSLLSNYNYSKDLNERILKMQEDYRLDMTQRSNDFSVFAKYYRPGHADYTFDEKFGFRDYRGGGRTSGRETIGRVAAGAIACEALKQLGINVMAYSKAIGGIEADTTDVSFDKIMESPLYMPDIAASHKAEKLLEEKMNEQDSVGGIIECVISGIPTGVGEPVFEKLDANLAKAVMSIGAVKGVEIGAGFEAASMYGSDNNDAFKMDGENVSKKTNNAGGILGGISDGSDIVLRAAVKPTPSIARSQETVNRDGEDIEVQIKGRHDPIIVPRAVVVVESMAAICAFDMLLESMTSKMYNIKKYFERI